MPPFRLGFTKAVTATLANEGVSHSQHAMFQVHIPPTEAQKLTTSKPRGDRQHVDGPEAVATSSFQQCASLVGRERMHLFWIGSGGFYRCSVAGMSPSETA